MRTLVQFVNFPKSDLIREIVANRIQDCFEKFSTYATSIRAFFSADGSEQHVKITFKTAHLNACINATDLNVALSIEKAIQKLESFLRRSCAKQKRHKTNFSATNDKIQDFRYEKNSHFTQESAFDKYENSFLSDFEAVSQL
jgi:ribosome-associated translation inhibitor RaiA